MVTLLPGVWHHGPFCVDTDALQTLIILPERLYAYDCPVPTAPRPISSKSKHDRKRMDCAADLESDIPNHPIFSWKGNSMDYAKESLRLHGEWKGKIEVTARMPVDTRTI